MKRDRHLSGIVTAAASLLVAVGSAQAVTYIGTNTTNADRWNLTTSWDTATVPTGADSVIIPAAKIATAWSATTPTYTGNLSIGTGSEVRIGWTTVIPQSFNALGTPGQTTITMASGSLINIRTSGTAIKMPAIVLTGNATVRVGESTQTPPDLDFDYAITGDFQFTLEGNMQASGSIDFNATNTFDSLIINTLGGRGLSARPVRANATGSLGDGNVTVNPTGTASHMLVFNDLVNGNAMSDMAILNYNGMGTGGTGTNRIQMLASETIGGLFLDGVQQAYGTYGRIGLAGVDFNVSWISTTGNGILNVQLPGVAVPEPAAASLALLGLGGLMMRRRRDTVA